MARALTWLRIPGRAPISAIIPLMTCVSLVVAAWVVAGEVILAWKEGNAWPVAVWAATSWARLAAVGAARYTSDALRSSWTNVSNTAAGTEVALISAGVRFRLTASPTVVYS